MPFYSEDLPNSFWHLKVVHFLCGLLIIGFIENGLCRLAIACLSPSENHSLWGKQVHRFLPGEHFFHLENWEPYKWPCWVLVSRTRLYPDSYCLQSARAQLSPPSVRTYSPRPWAKLMETRFRNIFRGQSLVNLHEGETLNSPSEGIPAGDCPLSDSGGYTFASFQCRFGTWVLWSIPSFRDAKIRFILIWPEHFPSYCLRK